MLVVAVGCGAPPCKGAKCGAVDSGSGDGGCGGTCSGFLPVCDVPRNVCVVCTSDRGCSGSTPVCDTSQPSGACVECTPTTGCSGANPFCLVDVRGRHCVECRTSADCFVNEACDSNHRCWPATPDAGANDGGANDGGARDAGSADAGSDGGSVDSGVMVDAGICPPRPPPIPCGIECQPGFQCVAGNCILNGSRGPVQVTLRWNTDEDVDLHVLEPVPGIGPCDIYYGNTTGSSCGARGMLDLDSNAGCSLDHVDIENVIYDPDAGAPSGTYAVRVDHYANCSVATRYVPYEVEVRVGSAISGYCGAFVAGGPGWNNGGSANSGTQVMTFVVP